VQSAHALAHLTGEWFTVTRPGNDSILLFHPMYGSYGSTVAPGIPLSLLTVADALARKGIAVSVVDLYRVKPVNVKRLLEIMRASKRVATIEEHFLTGGIGSLVAEIMADENACLPQKRFGLPDCFCREYGPREHLHSLFQLDLPSIAHGIADWVRT